MPKIPPSIKKMCGTKRPTPRKAVGLPAADRIEMAADKEGMYPYDLIRFPDLLIKHRIRPEEATPGHASRAWRIYREKTDTMLAKYAERHRFYEDN